MLIRTVLGSVFFTAALSAGAQQADPNQATPNQTTPDQANQVQGETVNPAVRNPLQDTPAEIRAKRRSFSELDDDGDGELSPEEFSAMEALGDGLALTEHFKDADTDSSGAVNPNEFGVWLNTASAEPVTEE